MSTELLIREAQPEDSIKLIKNNSIIDSLKDDTN